MSMHDLFRALFMTKLTQNFPVKVKVKVKLSMCLTKHHAMKTYWWSGCIALRILNGPVKVVPVLN